MRYRLCNETASAGRGRCWPRCARAGCRPYGSHCVALRSAASKETRGLPDIPGAAARPLSTRINALADIFILSFVLPLFSIPSRCVTHSQEQEKQLTDLHRADCWPSGDWQCFGSDNKETRMHPSCRLASIPQSARGHGTVCTALFAARRSRPDRWDGSDTSAGTHSRPCHPTSSAASRANQLVAQQQSSAWQ